MTSTNDTIAAISTATTAAAIGIVKISGPKAGEITTQIFKPTKKVNLKNLKSFSMLHGRIVDPAGQTLDEVLVSVMHGPKSYTAEDVVEINCHGGPIALRSVLELVLQKGAGLAGPGEFTKRAFLNGRIDLVQAEAVADIISAKTKLALKTAQNQLSGALSNHIDKIRKELISLMAQLQVKIDFSDEDIKPEEASVLLGRMRNIKRQLESLLESSHNGQILKEGIRTAIIGGPNVGKSSLLNALLKKERAIVTATAGTTRDIIEEIINVRGLALLLQDTAGVRHAFDEAEKKGIEISKKALARADLVLLVLDASQPVGPVEKQLAAECKGKKTIIVINKSDLKSENADGYKGLGIKDSIRVSALKLTGIDRLKDKIVKLCFDHQIQPQELMITTLRQAEAIKESLNYIDSANKLLNKGETEEIITFELNKALDSLGIVVGKVSNDEVLDEIFSNFCIGK